MSEREALIGLIYDAGIFETQLAKKDGPLLRVISKAREEGFEALRALIACDIEGEPILARRYQAEVQRYMDLIEWAAQFAAEGKEAEYRLNGNDVEETRRLIDPNPDDSGD